MTICLDTSVVVKLLLPESDSEVARGLWLAWIEAGEEIAAPRLMDYEVGSVLRLRVFKGEIDTGTALERWDAYVGLSIRREHDDALVRRAIAIAASIGQPRAYDAAYLALAERYGAPLWTAYDRFWHAARVRWPLVRRMNTA